MSAPNRPETDTAPPEIDVTRPHAARIYDYMLGGKDNFAADREVADQVLSAWPAMRISTRENRKFTGRDPPGAREVGAKRGRRPQAAGQVAEKSARGHELGAGGSSLSRSQRRRRKTRSVDLVLPKTAFRCSSPQVVSRALGIPSHIHAVRVVLRHVVRQDE